MADEQAEGQEQETAQAPEPAEQAGAPEQERSPEPERAPEPLEPEGRPLATGRRKGAVARVRLVPGTGRFILNGRPLEEYFPSRTQRMVVTAPLRKAGKEKELDVEAHLNGGGNSGQAGALQHGIARALVSMYPSLRATLKREGFLSRDPREKERRKYGLKKARKAPQYSKR